MDPTEEKSPKKGSNEIDYEKLPTVDSSNVQIFEIQPNTSVQNSRNRVSGRKKDPYEGRVPVDKKELKKYKRGNATKDVKNFKTKYHRDCYISKKRKNQFAIEQSARSELLLQDTVGSSDIRLIDQDSIAASVDITSATKYFGLDLNFGPYKIDYTRNGRHLLLGGKKGHVAALEWQTKKLCNEMNVMESITDVKWLHQETMFAVSQKQWTYIYDNRGIEIHCLKTLDQTLQMEYLPYHFLLVAANARGYLSYLDTSIGSKVSAIRTNMGRLNVMCQNPSNAIIHLGHSNGTVTLWSPNAKDYLVKMLCHKSNIRSIAVDQRGLYLATSGDDSHMKIWDLRTYQMLQSYRIDSGANCLSFSQRDMLAAGIGNVVQIFDNCCSRTVNTPYLFHKLSGRVHSTKFCPYEDVLGVGYEKGFQSLLIPGSGEPCFDALEANPYQSKEQRRETEVKMLLDKIQPDMISLDNRRILKPNYGSISGIMEEKNKQALRAPGKLVKLKQNAKHSKKTDKVIRRTRAIKEEGKRKTRKEEMMEQKEKEWREKYSKE
ncbi:WD repeat-containing protein 46 [Octopus sinensis]|uniref:WD repeat-containing protein 46 n=1 Tax=Octopus sinensis TaxID=2607531 RepID=A0A6P7SMZ8_9MOLL|nr:WD repeat-containing protein 46 [Octopus sinensis]XP_029639254.1 WD repeat-containing protein 46 [Octopus sinensis]